MIPIPPLPPVVTRWLAIAAACLAAAAIVFAFGWIKGAAHEAEKAARFEAATEAMGQAAIAAKARIESAQRANLERINHDLTHNLKTARDSAVDNYLRRNPRWVCNPGAGGGAVPQPAAGIQGDDRQVREQLSAGDRETIEHCAEDAAIRNAWDDWRIGNQIPVAD